MNTYKDFANCYIARFMETICLGSEGGIYNEIIEIEEGNEGIFEKSDIETFIKFQHGDNDYSYNFGRTEDKNLRNNIKKTAKALYDLVDSDWYGKEHYTKTFPHLIDNAKKSFEKII